MNDIKFRKSGIKELGNIPWGTHICQFYRSEEDTFKLTAPFIQAGILNNEQCIWVVPNSKEQKKTVRQLKNVIPDLNRYLDSGQLLIVRHRQWYIQERKLSAEQILNQWLEAESQALSKGFSGIRAVGMVSPIHKKHWQEFMSYEASVNAIISKHKMVALCSYPINDLDSPELIVCSSNHETILVSDNGSWIAIGNSPASKSRIMKSNGHSYSKIGKALGVSKQRAEQIFKGRKKINGDSFSLLTPSEAAALLNVHINTLRRWSNEGRVRSYRMGARGDRRFKEEDLVAFLS